MDGQARDVSAILNSLKGQFATLEDFEREFPSLCFALATGVGKTRLMGAFVTYLHLAHGINNFFVLAPNLTIYNKLIADFTPNTAKYVFKGIAEFAQQPPLIDQAILAARHEVYTKAKARHPARWSGATRDWSLIDSVTLNPERDEVVKLAISDQQTQLKAA